MISMTVTHMQMNQKWRDVVMSVILLCYLVVMAQQLEPRYAASKVDDAAYCRREITGDRVPASLSDVRHGGWIQRTCLQTGIMFVHLFVGFSEIGLLFSCLKFVWHHSRPQEIGGPGSLNRLNPSFYATDSLQWLLHANIKYGHFDLSATSPCVGPARR